MKRIGIWASLLIFLVTWILLLVLGQATAKERLPSGQLVYVPVYSHVYYGDQERQILLTAILSIRNTDLAHSITITKVDYYDSEGKLVRAYLTKPMTLKPMASTRFIVSQSDRRGGSGANFIVQWQADTAINAPLMEGVMIGTGGQQGISFTSRGVEITK